MSSLTRCSEHTSCESWRSGLTSMSFSSGGPTGTHLCRPRFRIRNRDHAVTAETTVRQSPERGAQAGTIVGPLGLSGPRTWLGALGSRQLFWELHLFRSE